MAPASCNCILRILLSAWARQARAACGKHGSSASPARSRQHFDRAQDLLLPLIQPRFIQPQRVGPAPSGPLWRGCAILLIRPNELPELNHCSGRFALRDLLRPALGSAAASPAAGRTCLRSTSSAYVCLCQSACTPIRLQPKRAAKEPPRGDRHFACIAGWIQTSARPTSHPHLPFAAHLHGMRGSIKWFSRPLSLHSSNQQNQKSAKNAQPHHKDLQAVLCASPFWACLGSKTVRRQAPSSSAAVCRQHERKSPVSKRRSGSREWKKWITVPYTSFVKAQHPSRNPCLCCQKQQYNSEISQNIRGNR